MIEKLVRTIRRSEKYTKTDMVYLTSGSFWMVIGKTISSVGSFILLIFFGNFVSSTDYGLYQYVLSIAGILSIPTLHGMNTAVTQAVARGFEGSAIRGIKTRIRWGLIAGLLSILLALYYYISGNNSLVISFLITAIFLPFMDSFTIYNSYLQGRKDFKRHALYGSVVSILRVLILIIAILVSNNIFLIIFTHFISMTLLKLFLLIFIFKRFPVNNRVDPTTISYGKHLSLMSILGGIATHIDQILVFHYLGAAQLAIYSFAKSPVMRISGMIVPMVNMAFPKFAKGNPEILKKTLPSKLWIFSFFILLITISYLLLAPLLYKIFLPSYMGSVLYSQIFAISLLFIPQKFLTSALTAHSQKKALYIITTVNPILRIALFLVLLPTMGILGALIAFLIPLAISGILALYYFNKIS